MKHVGFFTPPIDDEQMLHDGFTKLRENQCVSSMLKLFANAGVEVRRGVSPCDVEYDDFSFPGRSEVSLWVPKWALDVWGDLEASSIHLTAAAMRAMVKRPELRDQVEAVRRLGGGGAVIDYLIGLRKEGAL